MYVICKVLGSNSGKKKIIIMKPYLSCVNVAVFVFRFSVMFPMKKAEALPECDKKECNRWKEHCSKECLCIELFMGIGYCYPIPTAMKKLKEHPNLCQSHMDCINKGSGSFCSYYPNSEIQHGLCFTSKVEAERRYFEFEVLANATAKDMPMVVAAA